MDDQLEISETSKEKNQIIVNRKYKFNLWYLTNNTKVFKCVLNIKHENMLADGTFYIASIFGYQVFITRIYAPEINSFYTTSLSILNNKEQATYELLFEELKKNASKYNNNIIVTPKILNCDFEKGIPNAAIKIFPNITIKYSITNFPFINPEYLFDIYNYIKIIFVLQNTFFYELIYHLKREESLSYNNYKRKIQGFWKK
ncbi:hypothetical protein H8356DRAFT_1278659 [Neocallimastix lanati (nom. inval.)]|nr:hypothetical protein H8356DRAFT_1278659 [Neocallimastix sp. JGI-2020a]